MMSRARGELPLLGQGWAASSFIGPPAMVKPPDKGLYRGYIEPLSTGYEAAPTNHGFWNPPCLGPQNIGSLFFMCFVRTRIQEEVHS